MLAHFGIDAGLRLARKHVAWYSRGLPGSAEFRAARHAADRGRAGGGADRPLLRAADRRPMRTPTGGAARARGAGRMRLPLARRVRLAWRPGRACRRPTLRRCSRHCRCHASLIDQANRFRSANPAAEQFFALSIGAIAPPLLDRSRAARRAAVLLIDQVRAGQVVVSEHDIDFEAHVCCAAASPSRDAGARGARLRHVDLPGRVRRAFAGPAVELPQRRPLVAGMARSWPMR